MKMSLVQSYFNSVISDLYVYVEYVVRRVVLTTISQVVTSHAFSKGFLQTFDQVWSEFIILFKLINVFCSSQTKLYNSHLLKKILISFKGWLLPNSKVA